ncbi:hypothetical protein [Streptomyces sp. NPDC020362]|uniref:hypothetical protein n=1 Tax=unclassified Streptomyces TaxID=2593676 RepID=UPI0034045EEC
MGGIFGEGGVPDVVVGLDGPVAAYQRFDLGAGGLFGRQARDGVDGGDAGLAGLAVGAAAFDLDGLAGAGEQQVPDGGDLDAADLGSSMAGLLGAAQQRDVAEAFEHAGRGVGDPLADRQQ